MSLRSPKSILGRLSPKIGGKRPVHDGGIALPGHVGFAPHGLNPLQRHMVGDPFKLLHGLVQLLLPSTPPGEQVLQLGPGGGERFGKLRAQAR